MGKLFLTRNPYMKFQNSSLIFFERTDTRTDGQAEPLCQSWGHNKEFSERGRGGGGAAPTLMGSQS